MSDVTPNVVGTGAAIFDRGYRRYDGERTGVQGAIRTVFRQSLRRSLGLGRSARYKIIPMALIGFSFVPAIVFIGIAALFPDATDFLPSYSEYYGFILTALYLFTAFVGPDLMCSDQRSGMLGVYLSSPLTRNTYLVAKGSAVATLLLTVTLGPPLLLLIAFWFEGIGPDGFGGFMSDLWKILLVGVVMAAFYAAISLAVSATTDRVGIAIASTLGLMVGSAVVTNLLVEEGGYSNLIHLASVVELPIELASRIHGDNIGEWTSREVSTTSMWLAVVGIVGFCSAWIWYRYSKLLVRR